MTTSEQVNELAAALSKAQGQIEGAMKATANTFFKSKYADLSSVWEACRKPLSDNGLSVVQAPGADGTHVQVTTRLLHASGQWIEGVVNTEAKDAGPQAVGSAITYLRRYALQSFVGVAPEDDDAESAQGRGKTAVVVPSMPDGYDNWLADLELAVDQGYPALEKAFKSSKVVYRDHLRATAPATLEAMKAKAKRVTALFDQVGPA